MTSTLRSQKGLTYIAALVMVMILGLILSASAEFWATRMQREREDELLFRGTQYRDAMRSWYGFGVWDTKSKTFKAEDAASRTRRGLPATAPPLNDLKQLLTDPNSAGKVHHLRRLYTDPIRSFETGKDEEWDVVKDATGKIIGVKSKSAAAPLKQGNFPDSPETGLDPSAFEGKKKYSEWEFIYNKWPIPGAKGNFRNISTVKP